MVLTQQTTLFARVASLFLRALHCVTLLIYRQVIVYYRCRPIKDYLARPVK